MRPAGAATPHYLVRAKLTRAGEHLDALEAAIREFLDSQPYRPRPGADTETQESVIRIQIVRDAPVVEWGVVIGDVLHNLRSCLDHLAWHVGGNPPPNEATSEFPIFLDRARYRRRGIAKIAGAPPDAQAIIEDLQPFQRGDKAHLDPLWSLHELSNFDKHRLLHVSVADVSGATYLMRAPAGSRSEFDTVRFGPFEDDKVIARWPLDPDSGVATPDAGEPFHFIFQITFGPDGPGRGQPVGEGLRRIHGHIGRVVLPRLAPFLF
jgi:hypothetical protein